MPIARLGHSVLSKLQSGGGQNFSVPQIWNQAAYGSGWPIAPVSAPKDTELPRSIDYPIAVNSTITPRTGYGLMPFSSLLEAYENITEVNIPVNLIQRELTAFIPKLIDKRGNEITDHPYQWMCESPDGTSPFNIFQTRFLKSAKIYDAPAVYLDRDGGGVTRGLHYIDGSTLFIVIDQSGKVPKADLMDTEYFARELRLEPSRKMLPSTGIEPIKGTPTSVKDLILQMDSRQRSGKPVPTKVPAYAQIIKGTPFAWWSSDQIWYMPQSQRVNSPYGESFIEQAWSWIMLIVNVTAFELGFYRTGNMPEGFVTVPRDFYPSVDKILLAETMYNARMGSNPMTERMRLRFFPDGSKYFPTKKSDFPAGLYVTAQRNILHAIGVPPSELGDVPGQGLGGKGFKEGALSDLGRTTLDPHREFIASLFNDVLTRDGVDDAEFVLALPLNEVDPDSQRKQVYEGMAHGTYTLNDALAQLGLNPVEGSMIVGKDREGNDVHLPDLKHIANKHLIVAGSTVYVIEDMQTANGMAVPSFSDQEGNNAGGEPITPETVVRRDGKEHTPEDFKTLQGMIDSAVRTGNVDTKKTFVMGNGLNDIFKDAIKDASTLQKVDVIHDSVDDGMIAIFIPPDAAKQLRSITESLGLPDDARLELPENMHVTLAYLPDGQHAREKRVELARGLQGIANQYDVMDCRVQGYGIFNGSGSEQVLYASLDNAALPGAREAICEMIRSLGLPYGNDHGFVPHITLAYMPSSFELPAGFVVPDMDCQIEALELAFGRERTAVMLSKPVTKIAKHCGVCDEDDAYFGAPISRELALTFPVDNHVNEVEIVAAMPDGLAAKAFLWKAEGGESQDLRAFIGGAMYPREEAAYLVDRSLGFYLVPVAFAADVNGEEGAAVYYSKGMSRPLHPEQYAPEWIEKAAVLDYVIGQQDRGFGHNYSTHPDDTTRPVLFDNGLSFAVDPEQQLAPTSPFVDLMLGQPLSESALAALTSLRYDVSAWSDVKRLVGDVAATNALARLARLLTDKMITGAVNG